ncbi:cation:proton antiporter [Saccharopolyspora sp. NPDC050642]|uniref:cation:proton antiporter domain-containing protein n=1 Tax=Saccharopolyspora sp. NPDC050642 TaxID=3157099 RepID=UPI0033D80320
MNNEETPLSPRLPVGTRYLPGYLFLVVLPLVAVVALVQSLGNSGVAALPGADSIVSSGHRLLLAIAVILAVTRLFGALLRLVGQPSVVGEITAGIILGPSVLGLLLPEATAWLFPADVVPSLETLSQFGVILFMFLVGREMPLDLLRRSGGTALALAQVSTVIPFLFGALLAAWALGDYRTNGTPLLALVLFVGVAFAITAFPVLARILHEQKLADTPVGTLGLATAGAGDAIAWCLLMVVSAVIGNGSLLSAFVACALVIGYGGALIAFVRPAMPRLVAAFERSGHTAVAAFLLCCVFASAWITDSIGAHAIFGAVLAGLILPRDSATVREVLGKIEGLTMWLLLPLFFAVVGLKLDLASIGGPADWGILALIIVVAAVGKIAGVAVFARLLGHDWRSSTGLGLMMNCRGVTELIVLQIGLSLGVLSPRLFTMLTCMALVTTAVTGPLLRRLQLHTAPARSAA